MVLIAIVYVIVGVVIYAISDTSAVSSEVSQKAVVPSYGNVQKYLAVLIIFGWPVWLVIKPKSSE